MVNRNVYNDIIDKMREISSHYSGEDFVRGIANIQDIKENFDIKLMFVGHFSGGKSSLLNALMNRPEFLKEAQEPMTAIATELVYDEEESLSAYDVNGKREIYSPNKEYLPDRYNHLEYRLNVSALKEIADFTIVDTPGFDAGIETHAKALANYIGLGSAYIVVVDQEKGGLDQTTLDFLVEISNYSNEIAVLINKCDKIPEETAEKIAQGARYTLAMYGLPYKVYTTSKREPDISNKIISIISEFDAQIAFDQVIARQIKSELINIVKVLSVIKQKVYLDTFDLDKEISIYTRLEKQLMDSFDQKREESSDELDQIVQEVIDHIRSILISNADSVVEALLSGNKVAAEAIIVEIIRPIMMDAMKNISIRQIDDISKELDFSGLVNESENVDLAAITLNLANNLKGLIEQGKFDTKTPEDMESENKKKNVYRAIAGIAAISTDIIAPWLEVVIILLPDIINLVSSIFKESDQEIAKRRFINNVIPQIINKIYPQVKQNVETTTNLVLEEYEELIKNKIASIKNNVIEAQNKKNQKIEEFEMYKATISDDIEMAKKIMEELEW